MSGADWLQEAVRAAPGCDAAAVAWRHQGRLHLTVIAKATFTFVSDGPMARAEPRPILRADVHHGGSPAASVRLPSDVAPRVPRPQVVVAGHAFSAAGPTTSLAVRLGLFSGPRPLLHKELVARDTAPFTALPLTYERAFGGLGCDDNPLGTGAGGEPGRATLFHPSDPSRPTGLGVVGASWPARRRRLGDTPRSAIDAPIAEIPAAFDWDYFMAAPPDQEVAHLQGDEWLILDGLCAAAARLRTCLPRARAEARLFGLGAFGLAEGRGAPLTADTLVIDTDAQACSVVWRHHVELPGEEALSAVAVTAGVKSFEAGIAWPDPPSRTGKPAPAPRPLTRDPEKTAYLASEKTAAFVPAQVEIKAAAAAPFAGASPEATLGPLSAPPAEALPFLEALGPSPLAFQHGPAPERGAAGTGTLGVAIAEPPPPRPPPEAPPLPRPRPESLESAPPGPAVAPAPPVVAEAPKPPAPVAEAAKPTAPVAAAPKPPPKPKAKPKPRPPRAKVPGAPASVKLGLYGGFGAD